MKNHARIEIHFHQQNEVSVFLETDASGERELELEALAFSLYTIRQIANLGVAEQLDPFAELLLRTTECLPIYSTADSVSGVRLTPYQGYPGRKRFIATMSASGESVNSFDTSTYGFGWLARGVGYYGPTSILAFLRFLIRRRPDSPRQQRLLAYIAERIGGLQLQRRIPLAGQGLLALTVVREGRIWIGASDGGPELVGTDDDSVIESLVNASHSLWAIVNASGFRIVSTTGGERVLFWRQHEDCERFFRQRHAPDEKVELIEFSEIQRLVARWAADPHSDVQGIAIAHPGDERSSLQLLSFSEAAELFDHTREQFLRTLKPETIQRYKELRSKFEQHLDSAPPDPGTA